jgi:hypothetical protein
MLNITIKRNDTFLAMPFEVNVDNANLNLTNYRIELIAKVSDCGEAVLTLNTDEDGGMTITSANSGVFEIDEQIFDLKKGIYPYEMTFENETAVTIFTWIKGNLIVN